MSPITIEIMQDSYRFLRRNRHIIEESPDQAYISALLFAPKASHIRRNGEGVVPRWIKATAQVSDGWDACLETLLGHSADVTGIAYSSDGRLIASTSKDCTVRLWATETGSLRGILRAHSLGGTLLAFSPKDNLLASGSFGGTLRLWDTATGTLHKVLDERTPLIRQVLFAPTGQVLASLSAEGYIRLWKVSTGSIYQLCEYTYDCLRHMAFSHHGKFIGIAFGWTIKIHNVETGKVIMTFREHGFIVDFVQFAPDSSLVLSKSRDSIWLLNLVTKKPIKKLDGHTDIIYTAEFSPDGNFVASTSRDGTVIIWKASTGERIHVFTDPVQKLYGATFSADSKAVVTTLARGTKTWNTTTGAEIASFWVAPEVDEKEHLKVTAFSKDGRLFAGAFAHKVVIWEVMTGILRGSLEGHSADICDLKFSPADDVIASASNDKTIKLWSSESVSSHESTPSKDGIKVVALSPDSLLAASASSNGDIRVWDVESARRRPMSIRSDVEVEHLAFSPDSSLLVAQSYSNVEVWETEAGLQRHHSEKVSLKTSGLLFSENSHLLSFQHSDRVARIVETQTGSFEDISNPSQEDPDLWYRSPNGRFFITVLQPDPQGLPGFGLWECPRDGRRAKFKCRLGESRDEVIFSPDSSLVAAVYKAQLVGIWETKTGFPCTFFRNLERCARIVSFSPHNKWIAYIPGDKNTVGILELSTGLVRNLVFPGTDRAKMAFSPAADIIGAASNGGVTRLREVDGLLAENFETSQTQIKDIAFSPNEKVFAAAYESGMVQMWETDRYTLVKTLETGKSVGKLSFDSKSKFLWTGHQGFFLDDCLFPCTGNETEEPALSVEEDWVFLRGKRVLWLPPEFRINSHYPALDAHGSSLVIGHISGGVTLVSSHH